MQAYLGTKIIKAEPMNSHDFQHTYKAQDQFGGDPEPGYHVVYPNPKGEYHSWSPKAVFDEAYRPLNPGETEFITNPKKED